MLIGSFKGSGKKFGDDCGLEAPLLSVPYRSWPTCAVDRKCNEQRPDQGEPLVGPSLALRSYQQEWPPHLLCFLRLQSQGLVITVTSLQKQPLQSMTFTTGFLRLQSRLWQSQRLKQPRSQWSQSDFQLQLLLQTVVHPCTVLPPLPRPEQAGLVRPMTGYGGGDPSVTDELSDFVLAKFVETLHGKAANR